MNEFIVTHVEPGETLSEIAARYGVSVEALQRWNGIENPDLVRVGQRIVVYEEEAAESFASESAMSQAEPVFDVTFGSWGVWAGGLILLALLPLVLHRIRGRRRRKLAAQAAQLGWWRAQLAAQSEKLHSVDERLDQLQAPPRYLARSIFSVLERDAQDIAAQFSSHWPNQLSDTAEIQTLARIRDFLGDPNGHRVAANNTFVTNELARSREFFDRIEAHPLTDEQRKAVVVDEDHNLVVAAAGSGKTSVIVAKAGWLLRNRYRRPSELLLLAFAKDAQMEMKERVRHRLGAEATAGLSVRTFHSLGMSIIGASEGKSPSLAKVAEDDKSLYDLLKRIIADLIVNPKFAAIMLRWFRDHFAPYESEHEFQNQGEYWNYVRANELRSLKGELVKSYEECEIANFLYLNGVTYEYEHPYEHDTATLEKRQYLPDFYLPDAGIYIEHFALNASGDTPPFIDREEYLRSMDWKRQLHDQHNTVLIETFSHEKSAGKLIENLTAKLAEHGVDLFPIPPDDVFAILEEQGRIDPFTRLVATFLNHYKGSQLSPRELAVRAAAAPDRQRAQAFTAVFGAVFERYQDSLAQVRQIDFHDMINRATEHVETGRYSSAFDYILVDEFQDISPGRARLLKALLDQSATAQLFAVGDDWQAIYRFAGSDIAIMREMKERFGATERIDLATTFRCVDSIAEVATEFVLRNPAQIHKSVSSVRHSDGPCVHVGLPGKQSTDLLRETLGMIAADAAPRGEAPTVLLLGRYRHTRPENMDQLVGEHPELSLSYKTVHSSKGLEADCVVVLDMCSGKYGFPTEIADDPLLNLVLAAPESFPHSEERRLLYVAITRAKRAAYLLADGKSPSTFVTELVNEGYDVAVYGRPQKSDAACPRCVAGRLMRRENKQDGSVFYGCSHYPYCKHMHSACPHCRIGLPLRDADTFRCRACGKTVEACPACDGWLRNIAGEYGPFLGCSNYPDCRYTRKLE
ncbi:MAG: AAA family ATPase [Chromatiales bacterium]|nr:AAA family ATPase [Chromatiales bacterium]